MPVLDAYAILPPFMPFELSPIDTGKGSAPGKGRCVMTSYETRIRDARPGLSPSFARLADFLLDSYSQAAFLTATELAHVLDVDPATVVRFSQHLGYRGYPEFQREIRNKVKRELLIGPKTEPGTAAEAAAIALQEVARSLELTRRGFPVEAAEGLITALDEAERVIVMAEGLALPPARSLAAWLESVGYTIHLTGGSPPELARAVAGIRKGDLIIAVVINEETPFVAQALAEARKAGSRTAALLATPSSEAARHADLILTTHANPEPGVGQILLESMVYALAQMLIKSRPGLFEKASERVRRITQDMISGKLA
ncbi:MAG: MurR/RpiR family transcriptional regulator [Anaerolineales bacterium]|nr:MAG: MurR/RpiR family transcriptional regulator [Anaerolineales bacterium]